MSIGNKKLLVICGPTATGKTNLGIYLAKKLNGEIISADSRQVYRGLDIATGKDISENFKFQISNIKYQNEEIGYWETDDGVRVWLVDVVDSTANFSVATYRGLASLVVEDVYGRGKLPIVVGGTGLYIRALVDGIDTIGVPPNPTLRALYGRKTSEELYDVLFHLVPDTIIGLSFSERKNKQRLIRRIEIAQSNRKKISVCSPDWDVLFVGLTAQCGFLQKRIEKRIDQWVTEGVREEVATLLDKGVSWEGQAMSSLGYRQWKPYFEKKATVQEVVERWKKEEWQYARRQLTWFKKDERVRWFDVSSDGWRSEVEKLVSGWYN
ncbi:MAG: tRNA (adenosine(37)-N6)-dimethylallyltransferase MiaA [Candidatus Blackburnbacteria bacterium]|nr:tRNA (adenosine(37)-N6)-dimethylallyltransferase MiaA [Candidatus Blackburnbacteria bacterium]